MEECIEMKKTFPRSLALFLLILCVSLALSGCSSAPKDAGGPTAAPSSAPAEKASDMQVSKMTTREIMAALYHNSKVT